MGKKIDDNIVTNVEFFQEDIDAFDNECKIFDSMYDEIDQELKFALNNRNRLGSNSLTYIQEQFKNKINVRSTKAKILNDKFNAKIKISELIMKKNKNIEDSSTNQVAEIAKELLKNINSNEESYAKNKTRDLHNKVVSAISTEVDENLESRFNELLSKGEIVLTDNEIAMKYEKDKIEFRVKGNNKDDAEFIPFNVTKNKILDDYPLTLYPDRKLFDDAIFEEDCVKIGNTRYKYI